MNPLKTTDWLAKNINNVKILDATWHLPNINRNAFQEYKSRLKLYANNRFSDRSNAYEKDYSDQNYDLH